MGVLGLGKEKGPAPGMGRALDGLVSGCGRSGGMNPLAGVHQGAVARVRRVQLQVHPNTDRGSYREPFGNGVY